MIISKFSKDGKRGFTVGSNNLTPERLAAAAVTLAAGLLMSVIGGLIRPASSKKSKSRAKSKEKPRKKPLMLAALPFIYKTAKSAMEKSSFDGLVSKAVSENTPPEEPFPKDDGIEMIDAIPINSEEEVYEHI